MCYKRSLALLTMLAVIGGPSLAASQAPAKPVPKDTVAKPNQATTRIKITKEKVAGGEVVVPCDTVIKTVFTVDPDRDAGIRAEQYTLDSIAESFTRARLNAEMLRRIGDTEARIRAEFLAEKDAAALALQRSLVRGLYFGIAGGASAPQRALRNGYTGGYNVTVPLGYDATSLPWGIRVDGSVDHMNGTRIYNQRNETQAASGDITVWSLNTDVKLRVPMPKAATRTHFYTLTGLGVSKVTGGIYGTNDANSGEKVTFDRAKAKFAWNVGAGAAIGWGPAEVFIESRFMQVKTDLPYHMAGGVGTYTSFTPVLIGLQWF